MQVITDSFDNRLGGRSWHLVQQKICKNVRFNRTTRTVRRTTLSRNQKRGSSCSFLTHPAAPAPPPRAFARIHPYFPALKRLFASHRSDLGVILTRSSGDSGRSWRDFGVLRAALWGRFFLAHFSSPSLNMLSHLNLRLEGSRTIPQTFLFRAPLPNKHSSGTLDSSIHTHTSTRPFAHTLLRFHPRNALSTLRCTAKSRKSRTKPRRTLQIPSSAFQMQIFYSFAHLF